QKEYLKAIRGPKQKKNQQEEEQSDAMKKYSALKFKFKNQVKDFVEFKDPKREERIGGPHVEKFLAKLQETSQAELLKVKPVPPKKKKIEPVVVEADTEEKQFGVDLEVEDLPGSDWRTKKDSFFVAEDDDPKVTKAKDANMKDKNEDWYNIDDPRNAINKRRRGEVEE
ncbi:unnamed protein product, partial [Auanema sp. JU1783]